MRPPVAQKFILIPAGEKKSWRIKYLLTPWLTRQQQQQEKNTAASVWAKWGFGVFSRIWILKFIQESSLSVLESARSVWIYFWGVNSAGVKDLESLAMHWVVITRFALCLERHVCLCPPLCTDDLLSPSLFLLEHYTAPAYPQITTRSALSRR